MKRWTPIFMLSIKVLPAAGYLSLAQRPERQKHLARLCPEDTKSIFQHLLNLLINMLYLFLFNLHKKQRLKTTRCGFTWDYVLG